MGIGGKELQLEDIENTFNKIIQENFPNLKKDILTKIEETYRTQDRLDQNKVPSPYNN